MQWDDDAWKKGWATGGLPRDFGAAFERRGRLAGPLSSSPPAMNDRAYRTQATRPAAGSFIIDAAGTILAFDRNMERLTGWDAYEVVGRSLDLGAYEPPDEQGVRAFTSRPLFEGQLPKTGASAPARLTLHRKDGAQLDVEALVTPLAGSGGRQVIEIQRVVARIGAPAAAGAAEKRDPLTRLANSDDFHAQLREAFEAARAGGQPLSVLLLDIDHLHAITQEHGSERGDIVLRQVAGILAASVRQTDMVARMAGDNFALLLFGAGRGDARHVGGRIRKSIETFRFTTPPAHNPLAVSVSIGVASFPADAEAPLELLRRATEALAEAHRLGRNRVWSYVRRPRVTVNMPVYFDGPKTHLLGDSRDLSNSGMFVETKDELPEGMRIGLTFQLPGQFDPVHMIGRVARRVAPARGGSGLAGLGIEFERYTDRDRWRLDSFLHEQWDHEAAEEDR